jgi:hypothetical protein
LLRLDEKLWGGLNPADLFFFFEKLVVGSHSLSVPFRSLILGCGRES